MRLLHLVLTLAAGASCASAESLNGLPYGWKETQHATPDDTAMQLHVALQYQNLHGLEAELAAVSTPGSPRYGQYLDADSLNAMFAPSNESASKVKDWLQQHKASSIVSCNGTVSFETTVGKANSMLGASFRQYTNGRSTKLRTMAYSIPDELAEHIGLVYPTTYFGDAKPEVKAPGDTPGVPSVTTPGQRSKRQSSEGCKTTMVMSARTGETQLTICPDGIRDLYNTAGYTPDPKSGSNVAFANFLNETPSYSDLQLFEKTFGISAQNFTTLAAIDGAVDDQDPQTQMDSEGNLDVQYITAVAQGLPVYSYLTGGLAPFEPFLLAQNDSENQNEPFVPFLDYLISQRNEDLPYVLSISYGDIENTVPPEYAARACHQIGMLGLRGRSILAASGDLGVGIVCRDLSTDGNSTSGKPQFDPSFPGTCPYVTSVGGTVGGIEAQPIKMAWNSSSGGFSRYFPRAWYQQNAVKDYLQNHLNPAIKDEYSSEGYVDFSGRAFPDIAAHAAEPRFVTIVNGTADYVRGTSGSSPVVAGIVALLNDARFRAGRPAMGFLNPFIYSVGRDALKDITSGGSVGCNGDSFLVGPVPDAGMIPYASFNATPGWDPVTGYGTPNFEKLKEAALDVFKWRKVPQPVYDCPPAGGWGWKNGQ